MQPGEQKKIEIEMQTKHTTSYWDEEGDQWASEKGEYKVFVGNNNANVLLKSSFTVSMSTWWRGL